MDSKRSPSKPQGLLFLVVVAICPAMAMAQAYVDIAPASGIAVSPPTLGSLGSGAAFADFSGDGAPDLLVPGGPGHPIHFFLNHGAGGFLDRTIGSGLGDSGNAKGLAIADLDGDDDLDVFLTRSGFEVPSLFRNDGGGRFTDIVAPSGLAVPCLGTSATFLDVEGDGDLDLYVGNYGQGLGSAQDANLLFINSGGVFTEEAALRGVADLGLTLAVLSLDYDDDGDQDLFVANDRGGLSWTRNNALYRNRGDGTFEDVSAATHADFGIDAMGLDAADIDADGDLDVIVTNTASGHLLHVFQSSTVSYTEEAALRGAAMNRVGWGANFHDRDNDGDMDLFLSHMGPAAPGSPDADNAMLENDGSGHFVDRAPALGLASPATSFGVAIADLEQDGDLDLLVPDPAPSGLKLYRNDLTPGSDFLRVRVRARGSNRSGIGAKVVFEVGAGRQIREIRSSSGYLSASEPIAHFGVGPPAVPMRLVVRFPSGATVVRENVACGGTITIEEPELRLQGPLRIGATTPAMVRFPGDAFESYHVVGSLPSTPRVRLSDGRLVGVGFDSLTESMLLAPQHFGTQLLGSLNAFGTAFPSLTVPNDPGLVGQSLRLSVINLQAPAFTLGCLESGQVHVFLP